MNTENTSTDSGKFFYPAMLIAVSVISFFVWQLSEISKNREIISAATKQWNEIEAANVPKYQEAANRALAVEGVLNKLAHDVYDLSIAPDNDELAKKIVEAHGIKYSPPAGTPAPAPSGGGGAP